MKRRDFLVGATVSAASVVGLAGQGAQAPAPPGRQGGAAGQGGGGGRGRGPAPVAPAKLARISLMTLNFNSYLKNPNNPNPTPDQTLTPFDLPKMYVENYGVHNIEYQHSTIVQSGKGAGVHQGAQGEARREPVDDDPDQPGVRHGAVDLVQGTCGTAAGGRSRKAMDRHRGAVWLSARDDQPAAGSAHQGDARRRRRRDEGDGRLRPAEKHQGVGRDARRGHARI